MDTKKMVLNAILIAIGVISTRNKSQHLGYLT